MNQTDYRPLTGAEVAILERNRCSAADWSRVEVAEGFAPETVARCRFSGTVRIGKNVAIDGVRGRIENVQIDEGVTIRDVEQIVGTGSGTFGAGTRVAVLNEAGGREVPIYAGLTAQIACLTALYRHRPEAVAAIERLIDAEVRNNTPTLATIGAGGTIAHCGALTDICTGPGALLVGAAELTRGTVGSTVESPTTLGRGVIARDFVTADGAEVVDRAQIERCFVGQGCRVGKGFTATDSLFFANCECEQGEACAVFAGPYTVSHHKSTLLIGGMFSFYNAGSGTNMSNHLYRLGPVHQGVLERGCKAGSGSYLLFPARVGAFTTVIGRHDGHPATAHLPFSWLVAREGATVVMPGQALKSVGLARDLRKWPARDRRKGAKLDHIVFDGLNPYTVGQMLAGLESPDVGRGAEIYRTAIDAWLGEAILARWQSGRSMDTDAPAHRDWCDLAGLVAPREEVERIAGGLPAMHSIHELALALTGLYERYGEWAWAYARALMASDDLRAVAERGLAAAERLLGWQVADAAREFAAPMRVGYGAGEGPEARDADFTAVHGTAADHPFLATLRRELDEKRTVYQKMVLK